MRIRTYQAEDYERLIALWSAAGLAISPSDTPEGLRRKLERDGDLFLVVEEQGRLVAAVIGGYDGRRGWIYHLAVAPEHQGAGLGSRLLAELERRLAAKGCAKVNLLIESWNADVQAFYEKKGYARDDLIFMEKWLRS